MGDHDTMDEPGEVVYQTQYVPSEETITTAITTAIASLKDVPVTELPPLYDEGPGNALEHLIEEGTLESKIMFQYAGYHITVQGGHIITIRDLS